MNIIFKRTLIVLALILLGAGVSYSATSLNSLPARAVREQVAAVPLAKQITVDEKALYPVTDVLDGDTFKVKIDSKQITVRMLGINTPEVIDPRKPVECYGPEASENTKHLLIGKKVRLALSPGREKTDKYGRLLAYVYLEDGSSLNESLLKQGFAKEYTVGKPYSLQQEFRTIEAKAKQEAVGLWQSCTVG